MCTCFVVAFAEDSLRSLKGDWVIANHTSALASAPNAHAHALKLKDTRYVPPHDILFLLGAVTGSSLEEGSRFPDLIHLLDTSTAAVHLLDTSTAAVHLLDTSTAAVHTVDREEPSTVADSQSETEATGTDVAPAAMAAALTGVSWTEWCGLLLEHVEAMLRKLNSYKPTEKASVAVEPSGNKKRFHIGSQSAVAGRGDSDSDSCSDSEADQAATTAGAQVKSDREKEEEEEEHGNQVALMAKHYGRLRALTKQMKLLMLEKASHVENPGSVGCGDGLKSTRGVGSVVSKMD
jgi:hypothetical protein